MHTRFSAIPVIVLFCVSVSAVADYKDDIGFTRLLQEQGVNTPDGAGVKVAQVEAESGNQSAYMPSNNGSEFTGKTIFNAVEDPLKINAAISGHATSVAELFYGNDTSIVPAITAINAYNAGFWPGFDFLLFGYTNQPRISADRVANHSWIGSNSDPAVESAVLRRIDWVVETDEYIQCVGQKNNTTLNKSFMSGAYNVIAVGRSSGVNSYGTKPLDSDYVSGRIRPELVAPQATASRATPVVAAAAALLVDLGNSDPSLSTDPAVISMINRAGDTVLNAERSEVIKAALMAGADRVANNSSGTVISNYRSVGNQTVNGLDGRYGAGQVNIYNSFHIVAAGEQNSKEDYGAGSGDIGLSGFDYDPFFGGNGNSNTTATYRFTTGTNAVVFSATLAWNIDIAGGSSQTFSGTATLHNLNLALYDVTSGSQVLLQSSASTVDNTETIWTTLGAGKNYLLQVSGQGSYSQGLFSPDQFNWDFALAWQLLTDTDGDGLADNDEVSFGTDPLLSDTDGDGLDDLAEITNGTNPLLVDTDSDGLDDAAENTYGTDPLLADTDGDGFDDGMEVSYGSDPLLDTSTPADNITNNGDVNGDSVINVADVLLATRILMGVLVPTAEQLIRTDMVPDGLVTAGDLVRIQQVVLSL